MPAAPKPSSEDARLRLLKRLKILDTPAEEIFDRITRVVAEMLQVPIALVSLVDDDRQWFKSRVGMDVCETAREAAFCAHALLEDDALVVEDTLEDARFAENPLVLSAPFIRFYAGVPLRSIDGIVLGTLCAIDTRPRTLGPGALRGLHDLARTVEREIHQRESALDMHEVQDENRRSLSLSETRFAAVFQRTPTGKAIVDLDGRLIEVNSKLCEMTGYAAEELRKKTIAEITHPEDLTGDAGLVADLLSGRRESFSIEKRYLRKDASFIWVDVSVAAIRDDDGEVLHFVVVALDIGVRKSSEAVVRDYQIRLERQVQERTAELERNRETLQTITDNLPILISHIDRNLRYQFNNAMYRDVFGVDVAQLRNKPVSEVLRPELYAELLPLFQRALDGERVTHHHVHYSLSQKRIWSTTYVPESRNGEVCGFYVMSYDITDYKRAESALYDKEMHDALTGLPNRRALHEKLEEIHAHTQAGHVPSAVFFMDLDGFKNVNDVLGHEAGDEILKQVSHRLRQAVRHHDFVCRLGGDEFVVVGYEVADPHACRRIAESLCRAIARPFTLGKGDVQIGTSVGIAISARDAHVSGEALLASADAAMYEAKRKGRSRFEFAG